jgi:urease accessory protein
MDRLALVRLLTWLSPAFPTGGFAYSHGLEWSVGEGDVTNEAALVEWLRDMLAGGALWSDAILLRHAHRGEDLGALAELGVALAPSAERRLETTAQGAAFALAAWAWDAPPLASWGEGPLPYPVAVGMLAAAQKVGEDDAAVGYLHAAVANLVSAAVRLIPLGQSAGLRALAALEADILAAGAASREAGLEDLGGAVWASDIASMRHETQYTRLFRT